MKTEYVYLAVGLGGPLLTFLAGHFSVSSKKATAEIVCAVAVIIPLWLAAIALLPEKPVPSIAILSTALLAVTVDGSGKRRAARLYKGYWEGVSENLTDAEEQNRIGMSQLTSANRSKGELAQIRPKLQQAVEIVRQLEGENQTLKSQLVEAERAVQEAKAATAEAIGASTFNPLSD